MSSSSSRWGNVINMVAMKYIIWYDRVIRRWRRQYQYIFCINSIFVWNSINVIGKLLAASMETMCGVAEGEDLIPKYCYVEYLLNANQNVWNFAWICSNFERNENLLSFRSWIHYIIYLIYHCSGNFPIGPWKGSVLLSPVLDSGHYIHTCSYILSLLHCKFIYYTYFYCITNYVYHNTTMKFLYPLIHVLLFLEEISDFTALTKIIIAG